MQEKSRSLMTKVKGMLANIKEKLQEASKTINEKLMEISEGINQRADNFETI